jgi:hypothetical protein
MCLRIYEDFRTRRKAREFMDSPKIATKDILVWKVIESNGVSPYRYFKYEKGYHYYQTGKKPFGFKLQQGFCRWFIEINMGLHSCKSINRAKEVQGLSSTRKVVKMYIPKGAKYFENEREYVSDQLVWY